MPQKKNPDIAEIVRGKSARVIGNLQALLVLMKSQPLAYNRDNQEDKEPIFDTVDTVARSLQVFAAMVPSISFKRETMYNAALKGYATATDLAEYLVRLNVPFRDAHEIVGSTVHYAIEQQKPLSDLSLDELKSFGSMIENDVYDVLSLEGSVQARSHFGGTAPVRVKEATEAAYIRLTKNQKTWENTVKKLISISTLVTALLLLSACGQKGPLVVDQPSLEAPKTQDEELAPTK